MEKILTEALTFDDVLLVPQHSQVLAARGGAHHALDAPYQAQRYEGKRIVEDKAGKKIPGGKLLRRDLLICIPRAI